MAEAIIALMWKIIIVMGIPIFIVGLMALTNPGLFAGLTGGQ